MCLAVPGEVMDLTEKHGLRFGRVRFGGISREVCLEYQPEARVGDFVLVHVGFAISTIDAAEAARTWEALRAIGGLDDGEEEGAVGEDAATAGDVAIAGDAVHAGGAARREESP